MYYGYVKFEENLTLAPRAHTHLPGNRKCLREHPRIRDRFTRRARLGFPSHASRNVNRSSSIPFNKEAWCATEYIFALNIIIHNNMTIKSLIVTRNVKIYLCVFISFMYSNWLLFFAWYNCVSRKRFTLALIKTLGPCVCTIFNRFERSVKVWWRAAISRIFICEIFRVSRNSKHRKIRRYRLHVYTWHYTNTRASLYQGYSGAPV